MALLFRNRMACTDGGVREQTACERGHLAQGQGTGWRQSRLPCALLMPQASRRGALGKLFSLGGLGGWRARENEPLLQGGDAGLLDQLLLDGLHVGGRIVHHQLLEHSILSLRSGPSQARKEADGKHSRDRVLASRRPGETTRQRCGSEVPRANLRDGTSL